MPNLLDQIIAERRKTLAGVQACLPFERVKAAAERRPEGFDRRDFAAARRRRLLQFGDHAELGDR